MKLQIKQADCISWLILRTISDALTAIAQALPYRFRIFLFRIVRFTSLVNVLCDCVAHIVHVHKFSRQPVHPATSFRAEYFI
eukprot:g31773.t1